MKGKILSFIGMSVLAASSVNAAGAGDEQAVRDAVAQFYVALNTMFTGDAAPMETAWSHADDVTYMGPGGESLAGWAPIRDSWRKTAAMKLGGTVKPSGTHITVGQEIAIVTLTEVGENTNTNMEAQTVSIRATNVFRKEDGAWKVIHHHTDLLRFLDN